MLYKLKCLNVISCSGDCNSVYTKNSISIKQELKKVCQLYSFFLSNKQSKLANFS